MLTGNLCSCTAAAVERRQLSQAVNDLDLRPSRDVNKSHETPDLLTWWRGPAVEHWSLADVLSRSCARLIADG